MPKASLTLANGTHITIEGTAAEVNQLLALYSSGSSKPPASQPMSPMAPQASHKASPSPEQPNAEIDLMAIVNLVKSCEEADSIEKHVLDRDDQLPRVLLPMYIVFEYMNGAHALTSGQISKITTQISVPVRLSNVSKSLGGAATKYVIGDSVRKRGQSVGYKLSRRGHAYMKEIIKGRKTD